MSTAGVGDHTIVKARNALSRSFTMGLDWGLIDANPIRSIRPKRPAPPKRIEPPSIDDVRKLVAFFADHPHRQIWVRLMAVCGARPGELYGLQWDDIDVDRGTVRISRSIDKQGNITDGKNGPAGHRDVAPDLPTFTSLRQLRGDRITPWIFTTDGVDPWRPDIIGREVRRATTELELDMRTYDLRHFAATQAIGAGVPIPEVAEMLGDNPATVMKVYAHATPGGSSAAAAVGAALDGAS